MEWISVKDRLPELDKEVLCYNVTKNHMCSGQINIVSSYRFKMCNCSIEKFECEGSYKEVTHWLPLPSPPQDNKCGTT